MSPKMVTTPEVKSSFKASTSVVTRVTSRPTGFLSKNAGWSLWRWEKISRLMSNITRWPAMFMR